ncbi:MAG: hypothetical protein GXO87_10605 [Chlorobi bacterium]|nr:hypothetical protein [Chlorobiota bacterium]
MKKKLVLFVMVALTINISAQKIANGKIEMTFDGKKISAETETVKLQKGDDVQIFVEAKDADKKGGANVTLRFALDGLRPQTIDPDEVALNVAYRNGGARRTYFSLLGNYASYSDSQNRLEYHGAQTDFKITDVEYKDGEIKIAGTFECSAPLKKDAVNASDKIEIKKGRFEIVF